MAVTDYFRKAKSLYSSTTNSFGTGEGETITPASVAGLPTDTEMVLTFDREVSGKLERILGTISGSNFVISSGGRGYDGTTEQSHTSPTVEYIWNAADVNDRVTAFVAEHTQAGAHTAASTTATGTVELATSAETITGTDTSRAVTPAGLQAKVASDTASGIVELATTAETTTGTDATRAVTPDGLHDMTSLAGAAWMIDEDSMATNSATVVPSQQSVKAYVDAQASGFGPAFLAHKNGADQSFTASTYTKVTFGTEVYDTNSNFATSTFTPTTAGKYLCTVQIRPTTAAAGKILYALIYKNGVEAASGEAVMVGSNPQTVSVTAAFDMNGSTDYLDGYVWYNQTTPSVDGPANYTFFEAHQIA